MSDELTLRVLAEGAAGGAWNMAVDEALLEAVGAGASPATLRFYEWEEPTISLGYFQRHVEAGEQAGPVGRLPVVRRQTGGGAILHDDELTYSLVLPLGAKGGSGAVDANNIEAVYRLVHDAFIAVLAGWGVEAAYRGGSDSGNAQRGPFFCFARQHRLDLVVAGDKLLGSAQRRVKQAVLQHGSLILGRRFSEQPAAELRALAGKAFDLAALTEQVAGRISAALGLRERTGRLSEAERGRAQELLDKYEGSPWNQQR